MQAVPHRALNPEPAACTMGSQLAAECLTSMTAALHLASPDAAAPMDAAAHEASADKPPAADRAWRLSVLGNMRIAEGTIVMAGNLEVPWHLTMPLSGAGPGTMFAQGVEKRFAKGRRG